MFDKKEKIESFIGKNSQFKGDISCKGTVRVDGSLIGNVNADWVVIGLKGVLKGNITASGIIVGGMVEGILEAKEVVQIERKGKVKGDIKTSKFSVADGGLIDGKISMNALASKVVELPGSIRKEAG